MFKSVFKDDKKNTHSMALSSYKKVFEICGLKLPNAKKVNYSRSSGMNRADDLGAQCSANDQMSSHEVKGRKNNSYMRPDPHQIKHVNSGHIWAPFFQPYWNERSHIPNSGKFETHVFPIDTWNKQRMSVNGDKTRVAYDFVNVACACGARNLVQSGKF